MAEYFQGRCQGAGDAGAVGEEEVESCMFENEFTLVRQGGAGWEGSVEVVGFIRYHNTIEVPNDESWIVQGTVRISLLRHQGF